MKSNKSILWINYLKAISIIGVFFVHCNLFYQYDMHIINRFIHPFYVNAFFFVFRYLLFSTQLSEPLITQRASEYLLGGGKILLVNILFRLMIPSTLFAAIEFFPSHLLRGMTFDLGTLLYKNYWWLHLLVYLSISGGRASYIVDACKQDSKHLVLFHCFLCNVCFRSNHSEL